MGEHFQKQMNMFYYTTNIFVFDEHKFEFNDIFLILDNKKCSLNLVKCLSSGK